ncbi:hypothetical protein [Puia dinghuensis]|nr:hypothetical protein [Puia dinghuensis]
MQFKKFTLVAISAVTALFLLTTSCKKSNTNSAAISANVGGVGFSSSVTTAWYSTDSTIFELGGYSINNHDTVVMSIIIQPPFTLNTAISSNATGFPVAIDYYHLNGKDYYAGYGTGHASLTVTSLDSTNHKIAGNFTGTLYNTLANNDSVVVTNGNFNTSYIVQP